MKIKIFKAGIFAVDSFEEQVNNFLEAAEIRTVSKHVAANGDVVIFYEMIGDRQHRQNWQTIQETEDLDALKGIASSVMGDPKYFDLRNQQQREIYLLDKYNVNSKQADTVRELLRPEMAALLHIEAPEQGDNHGPEE